MPIWLRPIYDPASIEDLTVSLRERDLPIEVSSQPALWGNALKGWGGPLVCLGIDVDRATDAEHASHMVEAHLVEVLSSLGRPVLDTYCLGCEWSYDPVIAGAWTALVEAREEGLVRHLGYYRSDGVLVFEGSPCEFAAPAHAQEIEIVEVRSAAEVRAATQEARL